MTPSTLLPDEALARQLVVQAFGVEPITVRRFPAGLMHYVFQATFEDLPPVVVRIAASYGHSAMRGAVRLSRLLRPRGVPVPALLAEDMNVPFPYMILERLPGCDLGETLSVLSQAKQATAGLPHTAPKFGYAVSWEEAPHLKWSQVLAAHLERSRGRVAKAGRFDVGEIETLSLILSASEEDLAAIPATPFLHDTTTKNVIVSPDGEFSGIVDVDDLCFGDPRYVVALTHASLLTQGASLFYPHTWMRLAGFAEDRLFTLYVALFLADFMSERGQEFNGNSPAVAPERDQLLRRLYLGTLARL
jgi:aminoglycoside phosphotransferase (APT) family kinase protein